MNITGNRVSWGLTHKLAQKSVYVDTLNIKTLELTGRSHFLEVLKQMNELTNELPPCDLCIFEEYSTQAPSTHMFSYILQVTQARSMLLGCLAARPQAPQIISIRSIVVAKMFNTYVGSEKVSGQHLVHNMFETSPSLEMIPKLRNYYLNSESQHKELLSNVFLLNLAYWKSTNQFS